MQLEICSKNAWKSRNKIFEEHNFYPRISSWTSLVQISLTVLEELDFNILLMICFQIEEPNTPAVLRQACAAYITSFIARAKYISIRFEQDWLVE